MKPRIWMQRSLSDAVPDLWLGGLQVASFRGPALPTTGGEHIVGLALRSTARLRAEDLASLPHLRVVATASSGVDHLDVEAVEAAGVQLVTGRGGNAEAVADWVQWALSRAFSAPVGASLAGRRIVVVGVGAVGSRVVHRLRACGAEVVAVDPPRAAREQGFSSPTLAEALATSCDALSLHVPLTHSGVHKTAGMVDAALLAGLAGLAGLGGAVLLNAARGGIVDEQAAARWRKQTAGAALLVDTFADEPRPTLVRSCDLATPHIAGHSQEGRLRVAWLAVDGLRRALGLAGLPDLAGCVAGLRGAIADKGLPWQPARALDATAEAFAHLEPGQDLTAIRAHHTRMELAASANRSLVK